MKVLTQKINEEIESMFNADSFGKKNVICDHCESLIEYELSDLQPDDDENDDYFGNFYCDAPRMLDSYCDIVNFVLKKHYKEYVEFGEFYNMWFKCPVCGNIIKVSKPCAHKVIPESFCKEDAVYQTYYDIPIDKDKCEEYHGCVYLLKEHYDEFWKWFNKEEKKRKEEEKKKRKEEEKKKREEEKKKREEETKRIKNYRPYKSSKELIDDIKVHGPIIRYEDAQLQCTIINFNDEEIVYNDLPSSTIRIDYTDALKTIIWTDDNTPFGKICD